jgi:hypothetical protein
LRPSVPRGLTVLAAIRPGEEERLRGILRAIGDDIEGKTLKQGIERPHIDFCRTRTIHFARFAILDDPDRGANRQRLLYSSSSDGDLDGHLAELIEITSDMEAIWGRCEGYAGPARFGAFIRAHAHQPEAFYIAFRDQTVEGIRQSIAARRHVQTLVDASAAGPLAAMLAATSGGRSSWAGHVRRWFDSAGRDISDAIARLTRALPAVADLLRAIARSGFMNVFLGTRRITASLDRYAVFRLFNWITRNRQPAPGSAYSSVDMDNCSGPGPLAPGDEVPSGIDSQAPPTFREDVVTQNQLTLITVVNEGRGDRVRAVMSAIDSYARRLAPPGSLIGISTIHFVRWLLIDDGRRLLMLSDYDGSWESYIDEFGEMILSGLDAIWETSRGYPPDGARDLPALKRFLRSHQVPSEVFYSAYPEETVLNILDDLTFARASSDASAGRTGPLLQRL